MLSKNTTSAFVYGNFGAKSNSIFNYNLPNKSIQKNRLAKINLKKYTSAKLDENYSLVHYVKGAFNLKDIIINLSDFEAIPLLYAFSDFILKLNKLFDININLNGITLFVGKKDKLEDFNLYLSTSNNNLLTQLLTMIDKQLGLIEGYDDGVSLGNSKSLFINIDKLENNGFGGAAEFILFKYLWNTERKPSALYRRVRGQTRRNILISILGKSLLNKLTGNKLVGKLPLNITTNKLNKLIHEYNRKSLLVLDNPAKVYNYNDNDINNTGVDNSDNIPNEVNLNKVHKTSLERINSLL